MFCNRMATNASNEKLLIHVFQDSVIGVPARWYLTLKRDQISTWRDLACAFMKQYGYMLKSGPDRLTLQRMERNPTESFKKYAYRWYQVALQVEPALTNRKVNAMFVDTLPSPYYDKLVGNGTIDFSDLIFSVGRIENAIRKGKIMDNRPTGFKSKKDDMVQAITSEKGNVMNYHVVGKHYGATHFYQSPYTHDMT